MNSAIPMSPLLPPALPSSTKAGPPETIIRVPPVIGSAPPRYRFRPGTGAVVLAGILGLGFLCVIGVTGYFRLSSPTQALRATVMESIPGHWQKRFAVHVGSITLGAARLVTHFVKLPPEPKVALGALHAAEVGVYELADPPGSVNYANLFVDADKSMRRRGWERVVGVAEHNQFVAVYMPHKLRSAKSVACCVVVFNAHNLVVASAHGNLEPLLELAEQHLPEPARWRTDGTL